MDASQDMIADLECQRRTALLNADKTSLAALLSDSLIWTHANGATDTKSSYIAAQPAKSRFLAMEPVEEIIVIHGIAATVTSELKMTVQPPDKDILVLRTRASAVWAEEQDGVWRLVRFHSAMIS